MRRRFRLLVDEEPAAGVWNMSVDEALLDSAAASDSPPTLRWYRWREPTLSLGYFQTAEARQDRFQSVPWTRRLTGGGAILHDHEWTYSITLPAGERPTLNHRELVRDLHETVAKELTRLHPSLPALTLHPGRTEVPHGEPFLCFLRRSMNDLLCGDDKILGSAQRSRRGSLLQHGSILLRRSERTPELPGVLDLAAVGEESYLPSLLTASLAERWNVQFVAGELTADEREVADRYAQEKYGDDAWNARR